jgi:hypothetical protein
VNALIPFMVAAVITFVNGNIGAGVAIGGAFSRSVSAPPRAARMRSPRFWCPWVPASPLVWAT